MSISAWLTRERKKTHYQRLNERLSQEHFFQDLADLVLHGSPELGWNGDPWLKVAYNKLLDQVEIVDTHPIHGGKHSIVFTTQPGEARDADPRSLIRRLQFADMRTRSVDEYLNAIDETNEMFQRQQEAEENERIAEAAEHFEHAVRRDLGHLVGNATGKRYF